MALIRDLERSWVKKRISTSGFALSKPRDLVIADRLVDHHLSDGLSILLLFRCIEAVGLQVYRDRVYRVLHVEVLDLPVVIPIILVKNGNRSAVTRDVDALQSGVELDDIRPACEWQKRNRNVLVQIEDRHQFVSLT